MKREAFSYTILRYVHDALAEEFLNVGVVVFAASFGYARAKFRHEYSRLSRTFEEFNGEYYRKIVRHVENRINELADKWGRELPLHGMPLDARTVATLVLPDDDSALQFSSPGGGLTDNPDAKLEELFQRFVMQNEPRRDREPRTDEEVWKTFRERLTDVDVLPRLQPVKIVGSSFEYEFEHAWRNKKWHALEPLSMDAEKGQTLQDRAWRWVGRATDLQANEDLGKLYLLIGPPQIESLRIPYGKAIDLLHKMPVNHEIVKEDEAPDFARHFGSLVRKHDRSE